MTRDRVVFDCNVFLQAMINARGPAGHCVAAAIEGRVLLFCSSRIVAEIRDVASRPRLRDKFTALTDERLAVLIDNLEKIAAFVDQVPEVFTYPRDPDDAHYVNLALATNSKYVISRDRDLLDLRDERTPGGRDFRARFPTLEIIEPTELVRRLAEQRGGGAQEHG